MDLEQKAMERLRLAAQMSETYYDAPLIVTTSGGKDSDVCIQLALNSGIHFEVQHNHTTADAPETVYHVRETFKRLEEKGIKCTINWPMYKGQRCSMWSLIPQKLMPPTRVARYCCAILKEQGGRDRMITTGVRWDESSKRKNTRGIYESMPRDITKKIILSNENDDTRQLFENCKLKAKRVCNPIVDWKERDVWDYAQDQKIQMNPLYSCGFNRVGCIGCPMAGVKGRQFEFARYPKYEQMYIRAFDRMIAERLRRNLPTDWTSGEECFHWWMEDGVIAGQMEFGEEET